MIRYMYLYAMGGVYSDLDIVPTRPLEDFHFEDAEAYVVRSGNTRSVFTNSFMISKPGCGSWLDMLEHIKNYRAWPLTIRHLEIMYSTGPLGLTSVLEKHGEKYKISELPTALFMRFSARDVEVLDCKATAFSEGAFLYPLVGNSWHAWDSMLLHKITRHKYIVLLAILLGLFIYF